MHASVRMCMYVCCTALQLLHNDRVSYLLKCLLPMHICSIEGHLQAPQTQSMVAANFLKVTRHGEHTYILHVQHRGRPVHTAYSHGYYLYKYNFIHTTPKHSPCILQMCIATAYITYMHIDTDIDINTNMRHLSNPAWARSMRNAEYIAKITHAKECMYYFVPTEIIW